ncbi:MAG: TRAP transporter small permease [Jannaschia sp.]
MKAAILKLHAGNVRLLKWAAILAGIAAFGIMWVIDLNAFSRKLFNWPLPIALELTQSLLPAVIMLPFGWALATRHHVASAILTSHLSIRTNRLLNIFWMLVGCALFAAITYGTFKYAFRSYTMGEQVWGATLRYPLWPSKMVISLGTLLISVQFGLEALRAAVVDPGEDEPDWDGHA